MGGAAGVRDPAPAADDRRQGRLPPPPPLARRPGDAVRRRVVHGPRRGHRQADCGWPPGGSRPPIPSAATAVLVHGYADAKVGAIAWAPPLRELGLNVLAVDLRAHGESDGRLCTGGPAEADDVGQVIDQLLARRPDQARQVVLFGASLGAAVASIVAANRDDLAAVVLESPFASYRRAVRAHFRLVGMPDGPLLHAGRRGGRGGLRAPVRRRPAGRSDPPHPVPGAGRARRRRPAAGRDGRRPAAGRRWGGRAWPGSAVWDVPGGGAPARAARGPGGVPGRHLSRRRPSRWHGPGGFGQGSLQRLPER